MDTRSSSRGAKEGKTASDSTLCPPRVVGPSPSFRGTLAWGTSGTRAGSRTEKRWCTRTSLYSLDKAAWKEIGGWNWAYPSWSRDGETIAAYNQKERRIERWSRRTGRLEVVADASDIPLASWANASWIGLAPDGSPLILRDRSTRDIYALEWEAP